MPSHAGQLRRLPGRPQARRHRQARDQRLPRRGPGCFVWVALKRRRPRPSSRRCRRSSTCTSSRSRTRATATSGRRSRSTATRCSSCCTPSSSRRRRAQGRRGRHLRRPQLRALGAPAAPSAASQDVRARAEREPELLQARLGLRALRADGRGGRPLLPGARRASRCELERIEEQLFQPGASPRENIEALYYVKQKLTTLQARRRRRCSEHAGKLYGGRVPQVCHGLSEYFRDVYDHLVRINQSIDAARDTVNTAIQVALAMVNMGARRDHQAPRRLRRAGGGADHDRRRLRHELRAHAGARSGRFGYPLSIALMVGDRRLPLLPLPQGGLALGQASSAPRRPRRTSGRGASSRR